VLNRECHLLNLRGLADGSAPRCCKGVRFKRVPFEPPHIANTAKMAQRDRDSSRGREKTSQSATPLCSVYDHQNDEWNFVVGERPELRSKAREEPLRFKF
jgi:hypothetical protein